MATVWRSRCALARFFDGKTLKILNNSTDFGSTSTQRFISGCLKKNYSSYTNSPFVHKIEEQYKYEVVKNPPEWTYVERLLPFQTIPEVPIKESYSSGWIPPKEEAKNLPFFIPRTKNHEIPIYLCLTHRGHRKISLIKKIEGDIWLMNDRIKEYLAKVNNRYVETRVHELGKFIEVKGDFVNPLKEWAYSHGF